MYFERKAYLKELISAEGNGMIKIIPGIRRCGKSFLLFNIFRKHLLERGVADASFRKEQAVSIPLYDGMGNVVARLNLTQQANPNAEITSLTSLLGRKSWIW